MPRRSEASALPTIDWSRFDGIRAPTYTQTPDEIFDWIMAFLTGAELKVLLYITRRTFGFKKSADAISIPQLCAGIGTRDGRRLDWGTGLERSTVLKALRSLETKRLIVRHQQDDPTHGSQPTLYALNVRVEQPTAPILPIQHGSGTTSTPGSTRIHPDMDSSPLAGRTEATRGVDPYQQGASALIHPQQTVEQETALQQRGSIDISIGPPPQAVLPGNSATGQPPQLRLDGEYQELVRPIEEIGRELGDEAATRASVTRAYNLMREASIPVSDFVALLREAKALTRAHQAGIVKTRADAGVLPRKNLMPYFFAILRSLAHPEAPAGTPEAAAAPPWPTDRVLPIEQVPSDLPRPAGAPAWLEADIADAGTGMPVAPGETGSLWGEVLADLRLVLTPENFEAWLAPTRALCCDGGVLRVGVLHPFHKDWLDNKLRGRIESAVRRLGYGDTVIEFVVDMEA